MLLSMNQTPVVSLLIFVGSVMGTLAMERRVRPRRDMAALQERRLASTGRLEDGGTGTLVLYNPTGRPRNDPNYDPRKTLVGCLTAAHTGKSTALILPNNTRLQLIGRDQGGFSFVGFGAGQGRGRTDAERLRWRGRGSDWRFIGVAHEGTRITAGNVQELVDVAPYRLEYMNAPMSIEEGSPLHNVYYLNQPRAEREMQRDADDSRVTDVLAGHQSGMFNASRLLGPGASGSPYYDSEWNLVGLHRGKNDDKTKSEFTGINTVLDGHHGEGGLRQDALAFFSRQ